LRDLPGLRLLDYGPRRPRLVGPQLLNPLSMRAARAQLVHGPANTLPLVRFGIPGVVTVHDLAIYEHPEWFVGGQWFATRVLVPLSVRRARMIICPSRATMEAAIRHFAIPAARCRVIPHGVEPEFALPVPASVRAEVQTRYALPERYLLQVGTVQPRKNYLTSLRALARLPESQRLPLVAVGGFGWGYEPVVEVVARLRLTPWVRFVGYAGMADLPALYQLATAVLFPSLDEGFGLPVLEAFAAGTAVIASNAGAIPEVAGNAAILGPAEDEEWLAGAITRLREDAELRGRQVAAGRARAALYTWAASASAHASVYNAAAEG
jgi:alpha-1,3-rhamnosyl/mannosyltransferase